MTATRPTKDTATMADVPRQLLVSPNLFPEAGAADDGKAQTKRAKAKEGRRRRLVAALAPSQGSESGKPEGQVSIEWICRRHES